MLRLDLADHQVTATLGPQASTQAYADTPDSVWRATVAATRAVIGSAPYAVASVLVATTSEHVAVWDVETLGSPSPLLAPAELPELTTTAPHTWALIEQGRYAVGTLESYIVARLTRGTWHVSMSGQSLAAPVDALPDPVDVGTTVGRTEPSVYLGLDVPILLGT